MSSLNGALQPGDAAAPGTGRAHAPGDAAARLFWRTLEEREGSHSPFQEFPPGADAPPQELTRRDFVKLMAAGAALAGATACGVPDERILPYVHVPGALTPGSARHYATAMTLDGFATGLLVESHEGRPTKIEGNPDHPASLGAAGAYEQAAILGLYDPGRARTVTRRGARSGLEELARELAQLRAPGTGLRFLLEPTASPLVGTLVQRLRAAFPEARFTFWSPLAAEGPAQGARAAFGGGGGGAGAGGGAGPLLPQYDLTRAARILAVDSDFLASGPFHLRYARQWASGRAGGGTAAAAPPPPAAAPGRMSRLYTIESTLTVTGAAADQRLAVRPEQVLEVLAALGAALAGLGTVGPHLPEPTRAALAPYAASPHAAWARTVAADLAAHAGASAILVGERQGAAVHALAHALNDALGNVGRTTWLTASPLVSAGPAGQPLEALVAEMAAGRVDTLVIAGANPVYGAPPDLGFARALARVPRSVHHGLYRDETARLASWFVPAAHFLESWGDARAYDGTASIVQPLIAPLRGGITEAQLLALLLPPPAPGQATQTPAGASPAAGAPPAAGALPGAGSAYTLLRDAWRASLADESAWEAALQKGVVDGSAYPRESAGPAAPWSPPAGGAALSPALAPAAGAATSPGLSLEIRPDASLHDGRFAPSAWLQELPDPITKLTWGNAALLSPATAARLGAATGHVLRLELAGRALEVPAFVLPGQAEETVTIALGYGRRAGEGIGTGVGVDVAPLRSAAAPFAATGLRVTGSGRQQELATTQSHWSMEGRPIVLSATAAQYRDDPHFAREQQGATPSLYDAYRLTGGVQWAMVIDTAICTGCSACMVACQAENNIPVVGREEVLKGREMHWLRIDRYFSGVPAAPRVVMQPMLCQHCEHAPCEYVCPVEATVHSPEGLNEMVYNRCVGTRFCSNNCPYKVRRFNWLNYNKHVSETERMGKNPDVTVRARGVMEKCSFCVQRIERAEIAAGAEGRALRPGEVVTACQQACPTRAISFGSLNAPDAVLAAALAQPRRYAVLHDLGTRPRVTYLAHIDNPPEAETPSAHADGAAVRAAEEPA